MPLIEGKSKATRSANIKKEVDAGKSIKQAVAIGYSEQRKAMGKENKNSKAPRLHLKDGY